MPNNSYKVTFKGGGPKVVSNIKTYTTVVASSPHVAASRAMAEAEGDGFGLPKGAWVHLTVLRL